MLKGWQRKEKIRRMQSRNAEHPEHPVSLASTTCNSPRSKCQAMAGIKTFQHKHHPNLNQPMAHLQILSLHFERGESSPPSFHPQPAFLMFLSWALPSTLFTSLPFSVFPPVALRSCIHPARSTWNWHDAHCYVIHSEQPSSTAKDPAREKEKWSCAL